MYVNGREWLARQLDTAGVGYVRYDNTLLKIDDLDVAAELCDRFAHRAWPRLLDAFARRVGEQFDLYTEKVTTPDGHRWVVEAKCPKAGPGQAIVVIRSLAGLPK